MAVTFAELIELRRGNASLYELERRTDGLVKVTTWAKWSAPRHQHAVERGHKVSSPMGFPTPATIIAMAKALGVAERDVVLSMAAQLGLNVSDSDDLVIPGAGALPDVAKMTLLDMGTVLVKQWNVQPGEERLPDLAPEPV